MKRRRAVRKRHSALWYHLRRIGRDAAEKRLVDASLTYGAGRGRYNAVLKTPEGRRMLADDKLTKLDNFLGDGEARQGYIGRHRVFGPLVEGRKLSGKQLGMHSAKATAKRKLEKELSGIVLRLPGGATKRADLASYGAARASILKGANPDTINHQLVELLRARDPRVRRKLAGWNKETVIDKWASS